MKQKNAMILAVVWLLVMVSIAASTVTLLASGRLEKGMRWISAEENELLDRYSRLEEIRQTLAENFYREVSDDELMEGAIQGMLAALEDPYSLYYSPEEMSRHLKQVEGAYQGIGIVIENNTDGYIEVLRVYENGPADAAGIRVGDLIIRVDGSDVSGKNKHSLNDALLLMQGKDGTIVRLTVLRSGVETELNVTRGDVTVSNISSTILEDGIGYINIFQFGGDAADGFETALKTLRKDNICGLVIDVRNNPGGILDDVVSIADRLLPEGTIVYTEDRAGSRRDYYSDAVYCDLPIAVLINEMSASASEILAAAVQDFDAGTVVGQQSYGKGVVQTLVTFEEDGAGMQYTSACYYTPSGRNINGTGVTPDVIVAAESSGADLFGAPDVSGDVQLQAAIKVIEKQIEEGEKHD